MDADHQLNAVVTGGESWTVREKGAKAGYPEKLSAAISIVEAPNVRCSTLVFRKITHHDFDRIAQATRSTI